MKTQRRIKSLFAKSRVLVPANVDERVMSSTLSAFKHAAQTRPVRWHRKTMAKIAAGILVLATLAGVLNHFGVAFDGSHVALAQVRQALNRAPWVHVILTETKTSDQIREHELWFSPQRKIRVSKSDDPNVPILWSDYLRRERRCYEPKSAKLTVSYEYRQAPESHDPPWSYVSYLFGSNLPASARVTEQVETFGQTEAKVYRVVIEEDEGLAQFDITTDRASALPLTMRIDVVDTTGQRRATLEARFEYPAEGPRDIYDIGVPHTAMVVDERPTPEVEELARICRTYRANLHCYVFVVVTTREQGIVHQIDVRYVHGDTSLAGREWKSLNFEYVPWPPQDLHVGPLASVEDVLNWIQHDDRITLTYVQLWNGRYQHRVQVDNYRERVHRKSRDTGGQKNLHEFAWPCYLPSGRIIEDEYSKAHGFICWKPSDGQTFYFDPRHDYVCTRRLEQSGGTWVRDTLDFARTEAGLWYPRTTQLTIAQKDAQGQEVSREATCVERLFVKLVPEFPRGTFDSGNLAAVIGSKQAAFQLLEGSAR
jgi:hypothetical protein